MKKISAALCLLIVCASAVQAQVTFDPTFGQAGLATAGASDQSAITAYISLPDHLDDKIIVAGYRDSTMHIVRLNNDGTQDMSFANGGELGTGIAFLAGFDLHYGVYTDRQDNIVMLSQYPTGNGNLSPAITRFTANGSIDTLFGNHGSVVLNNININQTSTALVLGFNGSNILVSGSGLDANPYFYLTQLDQNGHIDPSFGVNGSFITYNNTATVFPTQITATPDGKILIAGAGLSNGIDVYGVLRFLANGTIDNTFANQGLLLSPIGPLANDNQPGYLLLDTVDNKIVLSGNAQDTLSGDLSIVIARYNYDGSADNGFGVNGKSVYGGQPQGQAVNTVYEPDGKYVTLVFNYTGNFGLVVFNNNGSINANFGNGGYATTPTQAGIYDVANTNLTAAVSQPDGKILLSCAALNPTDTTFRFGVARILAPTATGIADVQQLQNLISIYPNPAAHGMWLSIPDNMVNADVTIYDVTGKAIIEQAATATLTTIDVSHLNTSMYTITVGKDGKMSHLKFIKE